MSSDSKDNWFTNDKLKLLDKLLQENNYRKYLRPVPDPTENNLSVGPSKKISIEFPFFLFQIKLEIFHLYPGPGGKFSLEITLFNSINESGYNDRFFKFPYLK